MKKEGITAVFGNDIEIIKRYPDNHFDWGLCDPNYGIGASKPSKKPNQVKQKNGTVLHVKETNYKQKDWDNEVPSTEYFDEIFRVTKN